MKTLQEVREAKGVKVSAMADHLGVTRQTYRVYESKPESMSVAQAKAACEFLNCPVTDIFFGQKG